MNLLKNYRVKSPHEEMIFPLPSGKMMKNDLAVEISFLHTKGCGNVPFISILWYSLSLILFNFNFFLNINFTISDYSFINILVIFNFR